MVELNTDFPRQKANSNRQERSARLTPTEPQELALNQQDHRISTTNQEYLSNEHRI